ncbi:MAG TPA: hypothetical protein PKY59_03930 [Pyrinomonadaceae bacterium]|nr:hypothetical protein [Pyrinomonadaceae bacterium]
MCSNKFFINFLAAADKKSVLKVAVFTFLFALLNSNVFAQQTAGGTQIQNQAAATYSDASGNNYSTVSNTVTVTVANVSSLTITPDNGSVSSVVPGQQDVIYPFRVTNTGNFSDQVRFLANGNSIQITGSGTLSRAVIDIDGSGTINAGDTDIFTNNATVNSASIAQNGYIDVLVEVDVNSNATAGSVINVQLGDAATGSPTYDNQASDGSAHEVRTVSTSSVNGLREARGDVWATVDTDAQLVLTLTAPAGPVSLGSNISYSWQVCNTGLRTAQSVTLTNAPGGSNTGIFIFAPIPVGTALASGQTFPAGTLYSTSALSVSPLTATYTTTAPSDLSTVRRIAFNVGSTLAISACSTSISMAVTITTSDATLDIYEIGDVFAQNTVSSTITDQSGDSVANSGDGNANYDEGNPPGNTDGNGVQQPTLLTRVGSVLLGPLNSPTATGPTSINDDYTNRSTSTGIAGVAFGGVTTASGTIVFTNTIRNTGNANDTFVISRESAPAGFTVEISTDNGTNYTTVTTNTVNLAVAFNSDANILVRVTAPAGTNVLAANGFPVVIRATSTLTSSANNETIDRLYTGVLRLDKTATIINSTGIGGATDPVPGADIEYSIAYRNISSTGGSGNAELTISSVVITENGSNSPNNWATTTDQIVGSSSDTLGGTITGDTANSTTLTDTITSLSPQQSGTFKFRRRIR